MRIYIKMMVAGVGMATLLSVNATQVFSQTECKPNYIYAQHLVDVTVEHHPELTALVMHVTPPGSKDNVVVASNIWITGKKSDDDDVNVIKTGKTMTEMNSAGNKYEVQGVLKNVLGATVGSVAAVFPYQKGESKAILEEKAAAIRGELSKQILNATNLMEAFPFDPQIPWLTYARSVMLEEMARNSDILVFSIHAIPPDHTEDLIIASNISRVGKADDVKDIDVIKTGKSSAELKASDKRAQVVVPLKDASGHVIGVLNMLLHNGSDGDERAMIARGEQIRDETAKKIPNVTALFEPSRETL